LRLQVNAAVDELAGFAEGCAKAMSSVARNQLSRVGAEERIRLQELYHGIAVSILTLSLLSITQCKMDPGRQLDSCVGSLCCAGAVPWHCGEDAHNHCLCDV
jgi:hypothetical protein